MSTVSTQSTPRERLARLVNVLKRVRMYWRSTAAIAGIGLAIALVVALNAKRIWRSETTILYRDTIQTGRDAQANATARASRLGPKLKDMLFARGKLSSVVEEFNLYPQKTAKSMIEATEEMQTNISFRSRNSDAYVISFTHDDPVVAQQVTARLADLLIEEYRRENLDAATMTRDFLRRELAEASSKVEESSRALATFLAENPQFQWGVGDSPYAPVPQAGPGAPGAGATPQARPQAPRAARPVDPELASLERRLARIDAQLAPSRPAAGPAQPLPPNVAEAQKARDAAAAQLAAAEADLAAKLQSLTPLHPDAVGAKGRVAAATQQLAAAESALRMVKAGVAPDAEPPADLTPERRAELETERTSLVGQIAGRRERLESGVRSKPSAEEPKKASAPAKAVQKDVIELETEWHKLRLDLDRAREYLKTVQTNERAADMSADAAVKKSDVEMAILDPAYLPTRPDRGRGRIFFAGAALAFFFAIGLAGARVLLNDTLYDGDDVSALGGPAMLAEMPEIPEGKLMPLSRAIVPTGVDVDAAAPVRPVDEGARRASSRTPPKNPFAVNAPVRRATSDAPPPAARPRAVTIRFGSPLVSPPPPAEPVEPLQAAEVEPVTRGVDRDAALALMGTYAMARMEPVIDVDEPEIEVIAADVEGDGHGVFEMIREAPPAALAALRVLRHRLDQRRGDAHLVVTVASPGPGEGKTTLAARLAMTLAEAERARVVLVEGNLERPHLSAMLGLRLADQMGLSYQIRQRMNGGDKPLRVVKVAPSLAVLAEPAFEAAYPAAVHSHHFEEVMRLLRRHYDYVVIDGPSVLGSGDANVLESVSDGVILVARASVTKGTALSKAADQLGERRILGVVLNEVTGKMMPRKRVKMELEQQAA